jgi:hypothetical protein
MTGTRLRSFAVLAAIGMLLGVAGLVRPTPTSVALAADSAEAAGPAPTVDPDASLALLRITITTTSDWTRVMLPPGVFPKAHTMANSGAALSMPGDKIVMNNVPAGGATVDVRVLYQETTLQDPVDVVIHKGFIGQTRVTIENLDSGLPVADVTNIRTGTATNEERVPLPRAVVFSGGDTQLPHADARDLVLAFYYPWFDEDSYDDPRLPDRPVDPSDVYKYEDVLAMTQQSRSNGIDGFVVSWSGQKDGTAFSHAINAAEATGGVATGYLETLNANATSDPTKPPEPSVVGGRLYGLLSAFRDRPAFLKSDGVPVVFVFGMNSLAVSSWKKILGDLAAAGFPVRLVGDGSLPAYGPVMWGSHIYNPNLLSEADLTRFNKSRVLGMRGDAAVNPEASAKLFAATVSPGYIKGQTVVPRGPDGEHYASTWRAALASDPDWIVVTSWNEWLEGTSVQPGVKEGDLALRQTAEFRPAFNR